VGGASALVGFSVVSVFVVRSVGSGFVVGGIVKIFKISSSASSEISAVDCVSGCGLRGVEGLSIDVFSVVLVFAGGCSVFVIVGSGSPMLSWSFSVNCCSCCDW